MTDALLSRGFAPLREEFTDIELRLEGRLPAELRGTFYRTGPNPQFDPMPPYNPLNGDGMIHGFRIRDGKVTYRNRWVRTRQFGLEREAGRALFSTTSPLLNDPSVRGAPSDGAANTNLVWHGGRLLALEEGHLPIEIDPVTLETVGVWTGGGALKQAMTAHPKIDPATGRMLAFTIAPDGRYDGSLALYDIGPGGDVAETRIPGPYGALVHDFAISEGHVLFVVCPVTVSVRRMREGGPVVAWEPEAGTFVGVLPRGGVGEAIRWVRMPPRMVWHVMNAFEADGAIVLDVCEQDAAMFPFADGRPPVAAHAVQRFSRWTIGEGAVAVRPLHAGPCEYPRHDERLTGRPYRFGYLARVGGPGTDDPFQRGLGRFDHETGLLAAWDAKPTEAVGEPVFAARSADSAEPDGFILTTIHDEETDSGSLAIFEAADLAAGPIARAHAAHRIPMGFHALWKPD